MQIVHKKGNIVHIPFCYWEEMKKKKNIFVWSVDTCTIYLISITDRLWVKALQILTQSQNRANLSLDYQRLEAHQNISQNSPIFDD